MGKYKFWLSGMIPTAWFYKLKGNRSKNNNKKLKSTTTKFQHKPEVHGFNQSFSGSQFEEPATKSSNKTSSRRRTVYKPSSNSFGTSPRSPHSLCSSTTQAYTFSSDSFNDLQCRSSMNDTNGELFGRKSDKLHHLEEPDWIREMEQLTNSRSSYKWKEIKAHHYVEKVKENMRNTEKQRTSVVVARKRRRRRAQARARRNVASGIGLNSWLMESVVMVKTSRNPREDFRASMAEMIIENNITKSKDLEHLLACYLILNSHEYHELIINTFEQIWFHMAQLQISTHLRLSNM